MQTQLAYLTSSRIPGISANAMQVMKMAEAFVACGWPTWLAAVRAEGDDSLEELRKLYGVSAIPPMTLFSSRGPWAVHRQSFSAAWGARRRGAGLVFSRSLGAAATAVSLGLPTVFESHGPFQGFEVRLWRRLAASPNFLRMVVISAALKKIILERHPEATRVEIVVAHDGVDAARYASVPSAESAKRAIGRDCRRLVAGYAGHLYRGRGIELILDLAANLPNWDFMIVGGTVSDVTRLRGQLASRALHNVAVMGFVANHDLPATLAACDVLLMPYQSRVMVSGGNLDTAAWMSPLKMFEYLAMGRAIVASDLPVLREVLDTSCARLAACDDLKGWLAAMRSFEAEEPRRALAANAVARAIEYDWKARVRRIFDGLPVAA